MIRGWRCPFVAVLHASALAGCGEGAASTTLGFDEPLRARPYSVVGGQQKAQFREGNPPITPEGPTTTLENMGDAVLPPGKIGKRFEGAASPSAVAIGLRLRDLGSGHWVIPTGALDLTRTPPQILWKAEVDVGYGLPPGLAALRAFAIDDAGNAGPPRDTTVCLAPPIPDNAASCDPSLRPPAVVLSLSWDTNVDLDLRLVTPSGKVVAPGRPTTADGDITGEALADPHTGRLQFDSTRGCVSDGRRRETIVWQAPPETGQYLAYANLFDACDQSSVRFNLDLYVAGAPAAEGAVTPQLRTHLASGILLAVDANGGTGPGLFVRDFVLR
ncbi:MAG TPA: hypothetical protein VJT73_18150 [Polyangiaceae bacterium]|nr:hypothetical protein [Polyangiaceae bacterium]